MIGALDGALDSVAIFAWCNLTVGRASFLGCQQC